MQDVFYFFLAKAGNAIAVCRLFPQDIHLNGEERVGKFGKDNYWDENMGLYEEFCTRHRRHLQDRGGILEGGKTKNNDLPT